MNSIEIFSGAGGMAKGLELAGSKHQALVEWNANACNTLRMNYDQNLIFQGDVRDFTFADYKDKGVDIIAGGPPCQPFSLGGKAKGSNDERDMFPAAISAIRTLMPKAFIFENVKGLIRKSFAEYFRFIILQLTYPEIALESDNWHDNLLHLQAIDRQQGYTGLRYNVSHQLVNAADYGVPQKRERVIIVGFRSDLHIDWKFPKPTHCEDALLWAKHVTGDYWSRHSIANTSNAAISKAIVQRLTAKYGLRTPELMPWRTMRDAFVGIGEPKGNGEHSLRKGARAYPGHTGSDIDEPSKTIKAGDHGVPGGENTVRLTDGSIRYLSVLEAKRIQTFPDDYAIAGAWGEAMRQLGNAVPVQLAHVVGKSVINMLKTAVYKNFDHHTRYASPP
ncbi:MAG: DNA cytosine methyltransferase [Bacteroidales bacterium]|nr:DNA cytosine methyltransferase [Bacteroidales bacterium]